jgi:hypothetical protein
MRDFRDAKAMAGTLRAALATKGFKITISQSLERKRQGEAMKVCRSSRMSLRSAGKKNEVALNGAPVRCRE